MNEPGLQTMHPSLSVSQRAAAKLAEIHKCWSSSRDDPQPDFLHDRHVSFLRTCVSSLSEQTTAATISGCVYCLAL